MSGSKRKLRHSALWPNSLAHGGFADNEKLPFHGGPPRFAEIPWRKVRGAGNWLRHKYERIDMETVWG
jgi:hypothetical protein